MLTHASPARAPAPGPAASRPAPPVARAAHRRAVGAILHGPAPAATIQRAVDRQGGPPGDWGAALSCDIREMLDDPEAFLAHDPPWGCCSDMALAEIRRHFETAAAYTGRAIERMERPARMDSAIQSHFGPLQIWSYNTILENLRRIQPLLRMGRHDILCRPYGSPVIGCGEDIEGTASEGGPLTLCVDSPDTETGTHSGEPGETRFVHGGWNTVLHEVVHVSGLGDLPVRQAHGGSATAEEEARGEVETYHGESGAFAYPGPFSLRNADSYARFIEEVGSESWTEDPESGWRWVPQPGIMTGGILTPGFMQPVLAARLTMTGIGPGLQYVIPTFGVSGVWVPGVGEPRGEATPGVEPQTRAFVGGEPGMRVGVPGRISFVVDITTGVGARWSGPSMEPEFALYPRIAPSLRFGSPSVGGSLGIDFGRLFTFADKAPDEWILGLSGGIHWGGSASGTR